MNNKKCTKCNGIYDFTLARLLQHDEEPHAILSEPEFGEQPFVCPKCLAKDNIIQTEVLLDKISKVVNEIVFQTEKFSHIKSIQFDENKMKICYFADKDTYVEKTVTYDNIN